jgi:hypothetical protein
MFTFTCNEKDCANKGVEYNVPGNLPLVECGGCKTMLTGANERPDPVSNTTPYPDNRPIPEGLN